MKYRFLRVARGYFILFSISLSGLAAVTPGLSRLHNALVARLVKKSGLFDSKYYASQNPEANNLDNNGLLHFIVSGDKQGLRPSPVFDPLHYRSTASHLPFSSAANSLLHYALIGRYQGKSPSPHFDLDYYLAANPDVNDSGMDPLLHFLRFGGKEGRSPSRNFNSAQYLNDHPEVARHGQNPLIHYLSSAFSPASLGNSKASAGAFTSVSDRPGLPPYSEWAHLLGTPPMTRQALVDVIVPVYKDKHLTLGCIYSVLKARQNTPFELIVINDASPDEELVCCLRELAHQSLFTLLENKENQGYVYSANRGMELHPDRDVVQLNSDTEVFDGWLDRLRACAYQDRQIGTVTPLSNNATICSYPAFNRDNHTPLELSYAELDSLASSVNRGISVGTPTGVGFCMYIRRSCIETIGYYDQNSFGRGYGEENDFCQRALKAGWRNMISCDVFVRHYGSASFQGDRQGLVAHAMRMMAKLHPNYHADIAQFVSRDPLAPFRRRLDEARRRLQAREFNVLLISHSLGGGTERFVQEEVQRLIERGAGVFLMRPFLENSFLVTPAGISDLINATPFELNNPEHIQLILKELKIGEIQFHHLIGFDIKMLRLLVSLAQDNQINLKIQIHDYLAICPRINLVNETGIYCNEPLPDQCNHCLKKNGSRFGAVDIKEWRQEFHTLFRAAHEILVPDIDVSHRLKKYFADIDITVKPHELPGNFSVATSVCHVHKSSDKLKLVTIGAISQVKGLDVLLACADDARKRQLPLEFVVLGYTANDNKAAEKGIQITGRYSDADGLALLTQLHPHAVFLPSVWPETYCYTLSLALKSGFPVFAFDLGAISSRLRTLGYDQNLIGMDSLSNISALNDWLIEKCQKNMY